VLQQRRGRRRRARGLATTMAGLSLLMVVLLLVDRLG
jgi:hypothetical protein